MQPNTSTIQAAGDLGGEKITMSFDENSIAHLMSIMTDLYSNPELAVVREYSTNARDSHTEAGVKRPIEIETPGRLSPFFKVRDYGLGMSGEDIKDIYSKYGASTKRGTNEQTGMLGLGCKSALTYTNQFTLIGIKNGVKTSVSISRSADGGGVMEVIDETPTEEHNGVEIIIPSKRDHNFDRTVADFFQYWDESEVLINGKPRKPNEFFKINDELWMRKNWNTNSDVIVMGGIPYEVNNRLSRRPNFPLILFVPIGFVDFTPSREKLHMTTRTKGYLDQAAKDVEKILNDFTSEALAGCKTRSEALVKATTLHTVLSSHEITFNNEAVPWVFSALNRQTAGSGSQANKRYNFYADENIIVDFDYEQVSATQKAKISLWKQNNGISANVKVTLVEMLPDNPWLKDLKVTKWDDINKLKIAPVKPRTKRGPRPPIDVLDVDTGSLVSGIAPGKILVYDFKSNYTRLTSITRPILKGVVIHTITPGRVESFEKKYPSAVHVKDYMAVKIKEMVDAIPDDLPVIEEYDYEAQRWALGKNAHLYDDPEVKEMILDYQNNVRPTIPDEVVKAENVYELARRYSIAHVPKIKRANKINVINTRYSFAKVFSRNHMGLWQLSELETSLAQAINAIYTLQFKEKAL